MSKRKLPEALYALAAELDLDLDDAAANIEDPNDLIEWIREQINEKRNEALEQFNDYEERLNNVDPEDIEDAA